MRKRLLAAGIAAAVMGVAAAPQAEVTPPSAAVAVFLAGGTACGFATPPADENIPDRCDHVLPPLTLVPTPFGLAASQFASLTAL